MSEEDKKAGWLDFKAIKAIADIGAVVRGLKLQETIKNKGDEWVGYCPFHPGKGKGDSFHISESKKGFHCFCCKRKGSIIDFVKDYKLLLGDEAIGLREAASLIEFWTQQERFKATKSTHAEQERQALGEMDAASIVGDMDAANAKAALHVPNVDGLTLLVDFAEACRLVTFGRAHVTDFVAVRVDVLKALVSQLSPRMQAEIIDANNKG